MIGFISGHGDLTKEEFEEHYQPLIHYGIVHEHYFIMGDFKGADKMALDYLIELGYDKVIITHMFQHPRNKTYYNTIGGFVSDEDRDSYMTNHSDYDIAFVREGKHKSGTSKNIKRRGT